MWPCDGGPDLDFWLPGPRTHTHRTESLTQAGCREKIGPAHQARGMARHTNLPAPHTHLAPFIPSLLCFPTLVPPQTTQTLPFPPLNIPVSCATSQYFTDHSLPLLSQGGNEMWPCLRPLAGKVYINIYQQREVEERAHKNASFGRLSAHHFSAGGQI